MKSLFSLTLLILFCSLPAFSLDESLVKAVQITETGMQASQSIGVEDEKLCLDPRYDWGQFNIAVGVTQIRCLKLTPKGELIDAVSNEKLCPKPKYKWGQFNIAVGVSQVRCLKLTPKGEMIDAVSEKLCSGTTKH